MEQVSNTAIVMPLQDAGKRIRDKEIAQFYYKLLNDAGWNLNRE